MNRFNRQNLVLGVSIPVILLALLAVGSHSANPVIITVGAILFSFLGLTNYAIIHEATHYNLSSRPALNRCLGSFAGWLFPVSFTFLEVAHQVHHSNNRTDGEMFDYYYADDSRLVKFAQWYSILIGIYPPIIPLGSILIGFFPGFFRLSPWQTARSSSAIFRDDLFTDQVLARIRHEVIGGLLFWGLLWFVLALDWKIVLLYFAAFWINWSTRQYVSHAFSVRDVIGGAWNLKVSRLMGMVFLNGQWDLVHHSHPRLHWQELPSKADQSTAPIDYWQQYFRLWRGPRPNTEPAPAALTVKLY